MNKRAVSTNHCLINQTEFLLLFQLHCIANTSIHKKVCQWQEAPDRSDRIYIYFFLFFPMYQENNNMIRKQRVNRIRDWFKTGQWKAKLHTWHNPRLHLKLFFFFFFFFLHLTLLLHLHIIHHNIYKKKTNILQDNWKRNHVWHRHRRLFKIGKPPTSVSFITTFCPLSSNVNCSVTVRRLGGQLSQPFLFSSKGKGTWARQEGGGASC